jgi:hypothetical protein
MASIVQHTFDVAFGEGGRRSTECDGCTVSVKLLDGDGEPTGSNLTISVAPASLTAPEMTQWQPGLFTFTSNAAVAPFTRGSSYRATYTITLGGATAETVTQDFTAYSEATTASDISSYHVYSLAQLRNVARRALGIQEETATLTGQEPGGNSTLTIVNEALEALWNAHRWGFQVADRYYISLVANQYQYRLPIEFMELQNLCKPGDLVGRTARMDWTAIREMRERNSPSPTNITYYCVVSDPPDALTGYTRYILELWPTPPAYIDSGLVLDYYRHCPVLSATTDIAPFPPGFHSLVHQAVRTAAFESETDPKAPMERIKLEAMIDRAKRADGRHQDMNLGSLVRGHQADPYDPTLRVDPYAEVIVPDAD